MTQSFPDVPSSETLKDSRSLLLSRDVAARTMNSGTTLPTVDDDTYEDMIGMPVFKTDVSVNYQLTDYDVDTDTATWTPLVNGPTTAPTDEHIAIFDGTSGGLIKSGSKSLPTGDIIGTTDTQTLTNKTITDMTVDLAVVDGGTGASTATAGFDNLAPTTTKGDIIVSDGTNNIRVAIGTDDYVLTADSTQTSGVKWAAGGGGGGGGLTLSVETADFTASIDSLHYIDSTGYINVTLPSSYSVGDRFAIINSAGVSLILTNASVTTQSLTASNAQQSVGSSSSSVICGSTDEKMLYVEFTAVSSSQFIAYVNEITSNNSAGYASGGVTASDTVDTIDKLVFSTDTNSALSATLSSVRRLAAGYNSSLGGYTAGGYTGSVVDTIDKLIFSTDTNSALSATLSSARQLCCGYNSSLGGYTAGGQIVDTIDKLVFSTDTNSALSTTLSSARYGAAGYNSSLGGYTAGGTTGSVVDTIDKLIFSTDTNSALSATLSSARYNAAGYNSSLGGYAAGGYITTRVDTIDKLVFSTDTNSALSATLSSVRQGAAGYNSSLGGYTAGGYTGSVVDTIDKLIFSTDTNSALSATLSSARQGCCGFNN